MSEIFDWYWNFGVRREGDYAMPVGVWLDPIVRELDQMDRIRTQIGDKMCVGLWGHSQTGKSTVMSSVIEGAKPDGRDCALNWQKNDRFRFSVSNGGGNVPANRTFNPYNTGNDASGLATRYTLSEPSYRTHPVEIVLSTHRQILHMLACGYSSECESPNGLNTIYAPDTFKERINHEGEATPNGEVVNAAHNPEAYLYLKDLADTIGYMRADPRFANLFVNKRWDNSLRSELISCSRLVSDLTQATRFAAKVLWDSAPAITQLYTSLNEKLKTLAGWQDKKIYATLEVAVILLNIDSFKQFNEGYRPEVGRLRYKEDKGNIFLSLAEKGDATISGKQFGLFQALVREITVPLNREHMEGEGDPRARFVPFLDRFDILDFPGVPNAPMGNNAAQPDRIQINAPVTPDQQFSRICKRGKTLSAIYSYIAELGMDGLVILNRTMTHPHCPEVLWQGVRAWVDAFDPDWNLENPCPLPLFVNMTFFAECVNNICLNDLHRRHLDNILERMRLLPFARHPFAKIIPTTCPQFVTYNLNGKKRDEVLNFFATDTFVAETGINHDGFKHVFEDSDGGVYALFAEINRKLNPETRRTLHRKIFQRNRNSIVRRIKDNLPVPVKDGDMGERDRVFLDRLIQQMGARCKEKLNAPDGANWFANLGRDILKVLSVDPDLLKPLPLARAQRDHVETYVREQLSIWKAAKNNLDIGQGEQGLFAFFKNDQYRRLLVLLAASCDVNALVEFIQDNMGNLAGMETANARRGLAHAMGNMIATGLLSREGKRIRGNDIIWTIIGDQSPELLGRLFGNKGNFSHRWAVVNPFWQRLFHLLNNLPQPQRLPQVGDQELQAIQQQIIANENL